MVLFNGRADSPNARRARRKFWYNIGMRNRRAEFDAFSRRECRVAACTIYDGFYKDAAGVGQAYRVTCRPGDGHRLEAMKGGGKA